MVGETRHSQSRGWTTLLFGVDVPMCPADADRVRHGVEKLIQAAMEDGAAVERERVRADIKALADSADGLKRSHAAMKRSHTACVEALSGLSAAPQPSTIADAIRALIQDYAGRWADTENYDDTIALHDVMSGLRTAFCAAKHQDRAALDGAITWMRRRAARRTRSGTRSSIQAAADLEAIIARHGGAK